VKDAPQIQGPKAAAAPTGTAAPEAKPAGPGNPGTSPVAKTDPTAKAEKPLTPAPDSKVACCTQGSVICCQPAPACQRFWAEGEDLLWWVKRGPSLFPLLSGGKTITSGNLADPSTVVLFRAHDLDYGTFSGARLGVGGWLDDCGTVGVEARGFLLEDRSVTRSFTSTLNNGNPSIGFPFINAGTMAQDFFDFATPGDTLGSAGVASSSRLWGAEANLLVNLSKGGRVRFDALLGFRYLDLKEDLAEAGQTVALGDSQLAFGGQFFDQPAATTDYARWVTHNHFYGGTIGGRAIMDFGQFFLDTRGTLSLGYNHRTVDIRGASGLYLGAPTAAAVLPGELFALPGNIGRHCHDGFGIVPELEIRVGYRFGSHLSAFLGYNYLYWTDVARPGNQRLPVVNTTQVPTSVDFTGPSPGAAPPVFKSSDYWAQGINFGVEVRF
jgi:hypothetical protein